MVTFALSFADRLAGLCLRGGDFEAFLGALNAALGALGGGMKPSCEIGVVGFFIGTSTTSFSAAFT